MTRLDDRLVPRVLTLIATYGKDVVFEVVSTSATYDSATGLGSLGTPDSPVTVKATPPTPFSQNLIDGERIRSGDMEIYIAASGLTFTPFLQQRVRWGGSPGAEWTVVSIDEVYTGEQVALYKLQLRQ